MLFVHKIVILFILFIVGEAPVTVASEGTPVDDMNLIVPKEEQLSDNELSGDELENGSKVVDTSTTRDHIKTERKFFFPRDILFLCVFF